MIHRITDRRDGRLIYEGEGQSLRAVVEQAAQQGVSLDYARLDRARLVGARLDGASLDGASLVGARLDYASLDRARLVGARLDGASLDGASLDRARLVGARLVGASLDYASLVGARLVGASLDRARLVGARLDGALSGWALSYAWVALGAPHVETPRLRFGCCDHPLSDWTPERILALADRHEPERRDLFVAITTGIVEMARAALRPMTEAEIAERDAVRARVAAEREQRAEVAR